MGLWACSQPGAFGSPLPGRPRPLFTALIFSHLGLTLSGCAWIESAFPADKTLKRKGKEPPHASSSVRPSSSIVGPDGWVPSQSSAYLWERMRVRVPKSELRRL